MIRIITFDLDDTLWAVTPVMRTANLALYAWLEQHAPAFCTRYQPRDFNTLRDEVVLDHPEWSHSVTAIRLEVLRRGLSRSGYSPDDSEQVAQAAFAHFIEARNRVELFPHSRPVLEQLASRYQLGALSNGNADITMVGLADLFSFSFNADQVGSAKPEPLMFQRMLEHTGARPEQVLHVGDSIEHDVRGAQAAGLHTLWVNLSGAPAPSDPQPSLTVRCLSEIPTQVAVFARKQG
ncbi:HAD family hydrolase [Motiliproteus sediminis]|uniref:HAD family hydrolase n=1 Tax=Motiliproteus sediminis TaxID=1468178 RepID=UPI001AEFE0D2|nr:HAD-IA family hydrolase [Motiliproteus sediminis]